MPEGNRRHILFSLKVTDAVVERINGAIARLGDLAAGV